MSKKKRPERYYKCFTLNSLEQFRSIKRRIKRKENQKARKAAFKSSSDV